MHVDHRGTNTAGRPWVAVPRRRSTRRTALAAALGLLAASLALPVVATPPTALAEDGPKTFTAGIEAVFDEFTDEAAATFTVTITLVNTSDGGSGLTIGSANVTPPEEGVTFSASEVGHINTRGELELRELGPEGAGIPPDGEPYPYTVTSQAACDAEVDFGVIAKQSNEFRGSGNDIVLTGEGHLKVVFDCPDTDPDQEDPLCTAGDDNCSGFVLEAPSPTSQLVTLDAPTTPGAAIFGGYRDTSVATILSRACEALLGDTDRLAQDVIEIDPRNFSPGDEITITYLVPRAYVNLETNRGAGNFQVCFAPDENKQVGSLPPQQQLLDTGLYGPVLLPPCSSDVGAPCIESRTKQSADVVIVFRIPAKDPWMR